LFCPLFIISICSSIAGATPENYIRGSFTINLELEPQTAIRQPAEFDFDLEGLLKFDLSFDNWRIHNDLALGIPGVEHYILALDATVPRLALHDELWFAMPYNSSGERLSAALSFVENRFKADLEFGQLNLVLLTLLEDINFNHPYPEPLQPPEYGFGLSLELDWNPPEGPGLRSRTNICLEDSVTRVKGHSAIGRVCREGELRFTSETLEVTNLELIKPFTLDGRLTFSPDEPLRGLFTLWAALSPQLQARLLFTSAGTPIPLPGPVITPLVALYTLTLQPQGQDRLLLGLIDQDGDLLPSDGDSFLAYVTAVLQQSTVWLTALGKLGQGLQYTLIGLGLPLTEISGQLSAEINFVREEDDLLKVSSWRFRLSEKAAGLDLAAAIELAPRGLRKAELKLGLTFY